MAGLGGTTNCKLREGKTIVEYPFFRITTAVETAIVPRLFTRWAIVACCLVLLSVCSVEAQDAQPHFDVDLALSEGYRLLDERMFDSAGAIFEDVIAHDPKNRSALEGLVWVAFSSGRYAEAGRAADKVRILYPQDIGWTRKWIEVVWQDPARRGEASAVARTLLINDEDDIETRLLLAELLSRDPQTWAEAVTEYEKVLKRAPQNVQALIGRAHLAIWTGHLHDAQRESLVSGLRKLLGEEDIETRLLIARLLSLDPQMAAEAVSEYEKVLERVPNNLQALTGRARLAIWAGDLDNGYRFLQMALAVDPTNTIIAQQSESIKHAAKELSHSRMQLFVPLALIIIFLSIGIGYSTPELTRKVYLLLFLQVAVLMSLAALWVYVSPTAFVPNSN
jgi:tetratricopeptide (TPR) repeat protein